MFFYFCFFLLHACRQVKWNVSDHYFYTWDTVFIIRTLYWNELENNHTLYITQHNNILLVINHYASMHQPLYRFYVHSYEKSFLFLVENFINKPFLLTPFRLIRDSCVVFCLLYDHNVWYILITSVQYHNIVDAYENL